MEWGNKFFSTAITLQEQMMKFITVTIVIIQQQTKLTEVIINNEKRKTTKQYLSRQLPFYFDQPK
jgi:U3 small nucleolar RNA-associated protein 14